jgi:hypothetical protein
VTISSVIPLLEKRMKSNLIVPPGGFAGFAQQTAATQEMFRRAGRLGGQATQRKRRRKASKKKAVRAVGKRRRAAKGKPARLVKGSAAAKKYMASIRRKRRK